jgi:tetratricopeptide (TPR) repeat protein
MKEFAQRVKYERELRAWSQEQVAEMLGTTSNNVSRWERGITVPKPYFCQQLCKLFQKSPEELRLLKATHDTSPPPDLQGEPQELLLSRPVTCPLLWHLPSQRNLLFTGREAILARLHTALNNSRTVAWTQIQAITGLGGMGKTQTAIEYAYRYADAYQVTFWLRAETRALLLSDVVALADVLPLSEKKGQEPHEVIEAVKGWLQEHSGWLLVLDNLEKLSLMHEVLPATSTGHILVTTRFQSTGPSIQRIDLEQMKPEEGALLLLRRAKLLGPTDPLEHATPTVRSIATAIAQLMDGLPLALDQAGAYIEEAGCRVSHYFDLFQSHQAMLLGLRDLSGGGHADHPHSVSVTLSCSLEQIKQTNPAALDLLQLCSFLSPDAIPEEMLVQGGPDLSPLLQDCVRDPLTFDATIADLRRYSLLQRHPETHTLSLHRLVQVVVKDTMDEASQRQWATRAVQVVNRVFPRVGYWSTSSLCQQYFPQAQVCAALIDTWDIRCMEAGRLLTQLASYLHERRNYELTPFAQIEALLQKALDMSASEAASSDRADAQQILGWIYSAEGKYAQAEQYIQQALEIYEHLPEPDQRSIRGCLADLAYAYEQQGNYTQAEPLLMQSLEIGQKVLQPGHVEFAIMLRSLGRYYRKQGKYAQAEPFYRRALAISQKAMGKEHPFTVFLLQGLGNIYQGQGQYAQAESLLMQSLEIGQKVLQPGHPKIAPSLSFLGELYLEQGQYAQAEPLLLEALEIHQQSLGPEHPETAPLLTNLARLCVAKGKYLEAESLFQQTYEIHRKTQGPEHPLTQQALHELTEFAVAHGQPGVTP